MDSSAMFFRLLRFVQIAVPSIDSLSLFHAYFSGLFL